MYENPTNTMAYANLTRKWPELQDLQNVSPPMEDIIPWRDLPVDEIYNLLTIKPVGSKGNMVLVLEDNSGNEVTVWPCSRLLKDIQADEKITWIISYGLKTSSVNSSRKYFDYLASR